MRSLWDKVGPTKGGQTGTSLVVQWLRICLPMQGDTDSIPGLGLRAHMSQSNEALAPQLESKSLNEKPHMTQ